MGFLERLRGTAGAPPAPRRTSVLSIPVRIAVPGDARYTFLEHVDYGSEYDDREMRAYHAIERRTGGKFRTWRDDQDRVLFDDDVTGSQPLLPATDVYFHRPTGLIACAGFGRTEFLESPVGHDFNEYVWILPPGDVQFVRISVEGEPWSIDVAPDASAVAVLSWLGSSGGGGLCSLVDLEHMTARPLTLLKQPDGRDLFGGEELRFSPDGRWLLLATSGDQSSLALVEATTGRVVTVPVPDVRTAGWWPQRSASSLLIGWINDRRTALGALDLATGDLTELGAVELPPDVVDGPDYTFGVERLNVGPDGRSLLGLTCTATAESWSRPRQPRSRVAVGELLPEPQGGTAAHITGIPAAFLDRYGAAAVEQTRPHWVDAKPGPPVDIATSLIAAAREPQLPIME